MCGIAGIIHKNRTANIGAEMTAMLMSLKHRGPDSTGFALYGKSVAENEYIIRLKTAEQNDFSKGFDIIKTLEDRKSEILNRFSKLNAQILSEESIKYQSSEYAFKFTISFQGDLKHLVDYIEDIDGVETLSIGKSLELIKDLGDAHVVSNNYSLDKFQGTHAIGHTRMATESDVDIRSAHPYWAYPFQDVSVVHNGQLTNYWTTRRELERTGHRFMSNCDSELIAVYVANRLHLGDELEEALERSVNELDGVFTYLIATKDALGMAKDVMAAKPMVLMETDKVIAMASEEIAIVSAVKNEIDSYDPYEGVTKVWKNQTK